MSPAGRYMAWFDLEKGHWFARDLSTGVVNNLTEGLPVSFQRELHDSPSLASSAGAAGWTENDEQFLIYDRYDIWTVDPSGQKPATNVTQGLGRKNRTVYRYYTLDREEDFIDVSEPAVLSVFNEWTKASGYATADLSAGSTPEHFIYEDMSVYGLTKAKEADRIMLRKSTWEEYPEVYIADDWKAASTARKITDLGQQEDAYNWGTAELIEFESAFDGETMQAILYKPENFDPSKKYPMIVYFYERSTNGLYRHFSPAPSASTINRPYFVSNDYLVLVPDIKYEIGYPGRSAMNHVVPATQAVVDMGFVDEDKMAIQGQSWGGYQVAYMVTKTNMYAAAGSGAPVSNMTSAYGGVRWGSGMSRMFQYEKTQSRLGATLWERPDLYIENSPIFSMPAIETPLFIMHNDADGAVPWYQGIEYYMSLRRLQKPAWMVVYNNEAHNLRQRKNRKDLSIRMGQFFDHYLKGAPMPEWMANGLPATLKGRTLGYELVEEEATEMQAGESLNMEKKQEDKN
jgi:dipeptidyl aminopeptidase/acylaminoacyl peptidase